MNQTAIYSKTGKGVQEASGKTSTLSRADRAVLAAIDGKTTVGELNIKFDKIPEAKFFGLIEKLDRDGFIREASPGVATRPPQAPAKPAAAPAGPPSVPAGGAAADLDFTQILPSAPASKPRIDLAAKALAESERKAQEDSLGYKSRQEAEAKAKAEADARAKAAAAAAAATAAKAAKAEAEERARAEAEARARRQGEEQRAKEPPKPPADQEKVKEQIEREQREAMERARKEAEEKASREAEALRLQIEQERRAREEAEQLHRGEEDRKRREEEARMRKEQAERNAREEAERLRKEEENRKRREEEERKRKEEAERKAREEEERKRKEEAERKAREEAERRRKEEEERKRRKEDEERKRREEEERKRKAEAERKAREEAERRRKEDEERKRKEEAERKAREEAERRRREEEERKRRDEEERRRREEDVRKAREAADRRRDEEDRKRREEDDRRRSEDEQRRRAEAEERRRREEQPKAPADDFADSLLADLESFSQRDEEQRRAREAAGREDKEQAARAERARKRREEEERARDAALISIPPGGGEAASQGRAKRRLAAIVAADVVGYSRMMGQDEEGTLARLRGVLNDIVRPKVSEHGGHIVKTVGDGLLIEFASVVAAMRWAVDAQEAVGVSQADVARDRQIVFRMGINLGDIIDDDNDVFGDGVNVASRLEGLADHGGICISSTVYDQVRDKVPYKFQDLGNQRFKNISRPVRVYRFKDESEAEKPRRPVLQDAAAMQGATAKLPREEIDEVEVSDDDLRMDEVKRDEQALTKEARKAAREREKEEKRRAKEEKKRLKAEQAPIKPIKIRRPRKWGRTVALLLVVLVVGAMAAVHFAPVPTADYERAASAAFGQPVRIGAARMSLVRGLEITFERVAVGSGVHIAKVHAYPDFATVLGNDKSFRRIELDGAVVRQENLGQLLFGTMNLRGLRVGRIEATKLRLPGPLSLPSFDADVEIAANGALRSATLEGPDRMIATLTPKGTEVGLEMNAGIFSLPFAPDVALTSFSMKGSANRHGMTLTEWDGNVLDGTLSGTAKIQWGPVWTVEGKLKVHRINAAVFAPALLSEGKIEDGQGSYRMSGPTPGKLLDGAHIEGSFGMSKGVLGSFDLSRAIQTSGGQSAGRTIFAELTAEGVYDKGTVALRNVNIAAGALNAAASVEIAPGGALNARIVADMKTAGQTLRQTLTVTGTVKEPVVKESLGRK